MKTLWIGSRSVGSPLMLAPMAGISDLPFRTVVRSFGGVGLMFSEMIPCRSISSGRIREFRDKVGVMPGLNAVQISGNDPNYMSEAAKMSVDLCSANIVDINFGCPVKKVVKGFAGAAVMKDVGLARDIIAAVVKAVRIPVTVKMRLGWDIDSINAPTIAKIAEDEGVRMVTVHGRTRSQLYGGKADWALVYDVKKSVNIPVIVNGDIKDIRDLRQALEESHADGAMIGRGACGRPWIFRQLLGQLDGEEYVKIGPVEVKETILWHLDLMVGHYGKKRAIPLFRKQLNSYSSGLAGSTEFRNTVNRLQDLDKVRIEIERFFSYPPGNGCVDH